MKILVQLYVSGTVIEEVVIAKNYEDGKKTALQETPLLLLFLLLLSSHNWLY